LWEEWEEYENENDVLRNWPLIVGQLKKNEIALVLDILVPLKGPSGAKLCTKNNLVGWISTAHLTKVDDQNL
jgi:hypothetical protein